MARFEPKADNSLADLLSMADRAMYEAKKAHPKPWMSRA
jgi:GGDEF domain-containing protein